jgi:outer membrane protein assembly factor BamD (BamD/ComL family)
MPRQRFRRKDLKRPDEFVSRGNQFMEWAQQNGRLLGYAGGGIVVVALIILGVLAARTARLRQSNEDLSGALAEFRNAHFGQAATQLAEVADRWQATNAGRIARLYAASASLKADDFDRATTLLRSVLSASDWPPYLRQEALLDLGYAFEAKNDPQNAAARYSEASALEGPYVAMALLGEARCRESAGEKDKARALYERFTREFPQAPELEFIEAKVAALKAST